MRDDTDDIVNTEIAPPPITFPDPDLNAVVVERVEQETHIVLPGGAFGRQLRRLFDRVFLVTLIRTHPVSTGVQFRRVRGHICDARGNRLVIPAAYEPLAVQILRAIGRSYTLTGRRPPPLAVAEEPDRVGTRAMVSAVAHNERFVVRVGRAVDVAKEIVWLCRAFPSLRIVVLVKRIEDVRRLAHLLRAVGVKAVAFTRAPRADGEYPRVAVATYMGAVHADVGSWDRDMVIADDVADALGEHGRMALRFARIDHPSAPRVVGFAQTGFEPSLNQHAELMDVYGPVEMVMPAPGAVNRDVEYQFVSVGGSSSHETSGTGCSAVGRVKRTMVWENPLRNRLLARLACGLVAGDIESVVTTFPRLAGNALVGKKSSVLVVVENAAHARSLLHHLRNWYAVGPDIGRVPQPPSWGQPVGRLSPAVCTFDGLARLNFAAYDVVVRADAGTGALPLAPNALVTTAIAPAPLLLIDIKDRCDPVLAPFAAKRRAAYDALGWAPVGEVRRHRELDRFLARHPHGTSLRKRIAEMARRIADGKAPAGKA